jgi:hypothetical protein
MYYAMTRQFIRSLRALDHNLEKAIHHAEAKKFDPDNFCSARLAPDMFPLTRQVQVACDVAKRIVSALSGREAPVHEDTERTMAELRARVAKCLAYLETITPDDFAKVTPTTLVKVPNPPGKVMYAPDALLARSVPNFFFHVTTAYGLLRKGGVELGKRDYLGDVPMIDG